MTKPYIITTLRDVPHLLTGEPGWAMMIVKFKGQPVVAPFNEAAAKGGWRLLIEGHDTDPHSTGGPLPMNVYYKPESLTSRDASSWADPFPWPYPREWF